MPDSLQKSAVPKLRFPEFKGDWKQGIIRQYLQKLAEPVDVEPDEEYRQIGVRSHGRGLFHKDAVFGSELGEKRVFWVQPNALVINIVFAWEQAFALTTEAEKGMIASHRFPMFTPIRGKADLDFAFHFFMRKQGKALLALASPGGAGRNKTLGQSEFMKLKVTLPSAEEQKKIAAFLSAIDAKLEALRHKRLALNRYKTGLMQKLFSRTLQFTHPDGAMFPDWERKKLEAICSFIKDGTHSTHVDDPESSYFLLSAKNIQNGSLRIDDTDRRISRDEFNSISKNYDLQKNDILLSIVGTIGRVAIFDGRKDVSFQRSVAFFRPKSVHPEYLFHFMHTGLFQSELNRKKVISAQPGIYLGDLKAIKIFIPHPDEQIKISDTFSALNAKIQAVVGQISKIEAFKKSLLQKMFV